MSMKSIPRKITTIASKVSPKVWFGLLAGLIALGYYYGRLEMITQITAFKSVLSNITVNFVLALGLIGWQVDAFTRKMPKWKGWLIWAVVMGTILLLLNIVGFGEMFDVKAG